MLKDYKGRNSNVQHTLDTDGAGLIVLYNKIGAVACNSAMLFQVQNMLRKITSIQKHSESSTFEWKNEGIEVAVIMNSS